VAGKGEANEPLLQSSQAIPHNMSSVSVHHYPVPSSIAERRIAHASGAGIGKLICTTY